MYDLVIIGGGIAGATLGRAMALAGSRVLIVEQETEFKDRIRGEAIHPWGMAEARQLGIDQLLRESCGHELLLCENYWASIPIGVRDLTRTSPEGVGTLGFYHPDMQEVLLAAAADAGVEVRRGAKAVHVAPGYPASITLECDGQKEELTARLVVGADGRNSRVRGWAGLVTRSDPSRLTVASMLLADLDAPDDRFHVLFPASFGEMLLIFPIGQRRFRVYFVYQPASFDRKLSGSKQFPAMVDGCVELGAPRGWFRHARPIGPLAAFDAADTWVEQPCAAGVVVIGDAARSNDPSWGSGLSLALRDVRVLRDELLAQDDWQEAIEKFAIRHEAYYSSIHRLEDWLASLFFDFGPAADAARARVLPKIMFGGGPDLIGLGPDSPSDEAARVTLFGHGGDPGWLYWLAGRGMAAMARLVKIPGAARALSAMGWCFGQTIGLFMRPTPAVVAAPKGQSAETNDGPRTTDHTDFTDKIESASR
ncbi:MAG: FAD-dependent oxidoreductase [Pirellulales bacterium]